MKDRISIVNKRPVGVASSGTVHTGSDATAGFGTVQCQNTMTRIQQTHQANKTKSIKSGKKAYAGENAAPSETGGH